MSKPDSIPGSKKSYCRECKTMTETILMRGAPFLLFFPTTLRYCRICAKSKPSSSVEMEKQEKL